MFLSLAELNTPAVFLSNLLCQSKAETDSAFTALAHEGKKYLWRMASGTPRPLSAI